MDLTKLLKEAGKKEVAKAILRNYSSMVSLRRPVKKRRIQVKIPIELYEYLKLTAKSPGKLGERLEEIILQDVIRVVDEKVKLY